MQRRHSSEDPARRWRRFCRAGGRLAGIFAAFWFGALALLFRIAPAPAAPSREAPPKMRWWRPAGDGPALDVRAFWTPAAFALSTPAGFSHSLRGERAGLAPPVHAIRSPAVFLADARALPTPDFAARERPDFDLPASPAASVPVESVFPPRTPAAETPRLDFPAGWESRLFSGIDLDFQSWTNAAWEARIEMQFDAKGVPTSMLLAQGSGLPEVDRRLVRSASGWRLLEPAAPRTGVVAWNSPLAAASAGGSP